MSENSAYKSPFVHLAIGVGVIVGLWLVLFVAIPLVAVPAALSNQVAHAGITTRLNLTALIFVGILIWLAKNRVSEKQFWQTYWVYGISWIVISLLGEGGAEIVFALRDRSIIDTSNAVTVTLINSATIVGPVVVTLIYAWRTGMITKIYGLGVYGSPQENLGDEKISVETDQTTSQAGTIDHSNELQPQTSNEAIARPDMEPAWDKRGISNTEDRPTVYDSSISEPETINEEMINKPKLEAGWSDEFKILYEYDPIVKECHDELEGLDPLLSTKFREEVVSDRKKAAIIRDRLKAERENKMKPYGSESLNEALAEARLLGPSAEEEFTRVIEVMGEDVEIETVLDRLTEKFGLSSSPQDMDGDLEYWGIIKHGSERFSFGRFNFTSEDAARSFAQEKLDNFFIDTPFSTLSDVLTSEGYIVQKVLSGNFHVTAQDGTSVTLTENEFSRYIKGKITPKEIRQFFDYLNQ